MKRISLQHFLAAVRRLPAIISGASIERLWMACVALFLLLTLLLAAAAVGVFIGAARDSGPAFPPAPAVQTLDRAKLKDVLEGFERRSRDFETLATNPPALKDPR